MLSLNPAAKEKVLEAAATRNAGAIGAPAIDGVGRRIHGEVGMMIGTNGTRSMFGPGRSRSPSKIAAMAGVAEIARLPAAC